MENKTKISIILLLIMLIILLFYFYQDNIRVNPPPPRNLSGSYTGDYIELHWDAPETVKASHNYSDIITHYNIYRGITENNLSYLASTPGTDFKDHNISGNTQYIYEVTAVHEGNTESVPSQEINIQISAIIPTGLTYEEELRVNPPPPRNLSGSYTGDYIELHWEAPETVKVSHNYSDIITHYNIYRGTTENDITYLASTPGTDFKDHNISGSIQYIYEVTAVHEGNTESVPSQEIIVITGITTPSGGERNKSSN